MKAASNNGNFPPPPDHKASYSTVLARRWFWPPHCVLSMQFQLPCPGSKCDNVRMPHCANSKPLNCDHPYCCISCSPSKSPLFCFVSSNFGSPAFFNSMHVFKQVSITVACLPKGVLNNFQSVLVFPIVLSYNM